MAKYIGIVLTLDGYFCAAPPWAVKEGDMVTLPNPLTGEDGIHEVISVVTDTADGEFLEMVTKYTGAPLPRVKAKFSKRELEWGEDYGVE